MLHDIGIGVSVHWLSSSKYAGLLVSKDHAWLWNGSKEPRLATTQQKSRNQFYRDEKKCRVSQLTSHFFLPCTLFPLFVPLPDGPTRILLRNVCLHLSSLPPSKPQLIPRSHDTDSQSAWRPQLYHWVECPLRAIKTATWRLFRTAIGVGQTAELRPQTVPAERDFTAPFCFRASWPTSQGRCVSDSYPHDGFAWHCQPRVQTHCGSGF